MKWMRSSFPMYLMGISAVAIVGIAFAQNQNPEKAAAPKADNAATQRKTDNPPADPRATAGKPQVAGLGAQFQIQGNEGLRVTTVEENGTLARAGLKQNDRIVSIDNYPFNNPRQVEAYLWSHTGRLMPMVVERDGKQTTLHVMVPVPQQRGGWLGIYLDEGETNVKGARISQIYPSGPAARANLQPGDVITQIDAHPVAGSADAVMLVRELQPNTQVEFTITRGSQEEKIPVTVGSRSAANANYQSGFAGGPQNNQHPPQGQEWNEANQFNGVPPHAMELESDRRNFEQHERIEEEIRMLREEIQKLRESLQKK